MTIIDRAEASVHSLETTGALGRTYPRELGDSEEGVVAGLGRSLVADSSIGLKPTQWIVALARDELQVCSAASQAQPGPESPSDSGPGCISGSTSIWSGCFSLIQFGRSDELANESPAGHQGLPELLGSRLATLAARRGLVHQSVVVHELGVCGG
jgi:hypothetical protein